MPIHFISGLPRAGASLISDILTQNPEVHANGYSSLSQVIKFAVQAWDSAHVGKPTNTTDKINTLSAMIKGYYAHNTKPVIFDNSLQWVSMISVLETILQTEVKILICVRNPAEILSSFEKIRKQNPLLKLDVDNALKDNSIASRAYFYSGPEGILGITHRNIQDAIIMGYLDRFLFVDYNRFCSSPKSQTKRIYDFFKLNYFEHDFENIAKVNPLDWSIKNMPINKTTVNCVEYLGLDLYEQYNRQIFWNAWV